MFYKTFLFLIGLAIATPNFAQFLTDDVRFWSGNGENSAVLVIDFTIEEEDCSFAWGYRFDGSITAADLLEGISSKDVDLTVNQESFLNDIYFLDFLGEAGAPNYWTTWTKTDDTEWSTNFGLGTAINDGDWFGCNYTGYDEEFNPIYSMTEPIATDPNQDLGPYAPAADETGTTAIAMDSELIMAWASTCEITRGPQYIGVNDTEASFGSENAAIGSVDGLDVVSLGDGGVAVLTFESPIINGSGADFAVFENAFDDTFLELAFVEVSSDGTNYVRFPSHCLTQYATQLEAFDETNPTHIYNLAGKYRATYGTPFDLEELVDIENLDINNITHIKIIDVVGSIDPEFAQADASGNTINDPFPTDFESGGFDLDGIGVLNQTVTIEELQSPQISIYPNPTNDMVTVKTNDLGTLQIFNSIGKLVLESNSNTLSQSISLSKLEAGIYFITFRETNGTFTTQELLLTK